MLEEVRGTGSVTWKCDSAVSGGENFTACALGAPSSQAMFRKGANRQFLRFARGFSQCRLLKASRAVFVVSGKECSDLGSMSAVGLREMSQLG